MALSEEEKNEIKRTVLIELENTFTSITHKLNTKENREKILFLLDIESSIKQRMMEIDSQNQ